MMNRREMVVNRLGMLAMCAIAGSAAGRALAGTASPADSRFQNQMQDIEASCGGRLGVATLDTLGGVHRAWRGDERFPMASTFKLTLAALVLSRVDQGVESLQRKVVFEKSDLVTYSPVTEKHVGPGGMSMAELCEATVTWSDNGAANLIMKTLGGPEAVTAFLRKIGDQKSRLDRWETELNSAIPGDPRDTTTPNAMLSTVRRIVLGDALSQASRQQMTSWLLSNKVGDAKFRAGVPPDSRVADKTGGGGNGTNNDIGVIWLPNRAPIVVTCYLTNTTADGKQRDAVIANVTKAIVALT